MSEERKLGFETDDPYVAVSTGNSLIYKTGNQRTDKPIFINKAAPCRQSCPIGIDISLAFHLASTGDIDGALQVYLQDNPIPGVCGRVCYHPCEMECNRGHFDEPVNIRAFERFLSDEERGNINDVIQAPSKKEKLAVIGSGPSGLSAAYHLVRLGYPVTLFESKKELGGMLRYGIPRYRLPRDILEREIERIISLGIQVRTKTTIGKGVPWKELDRFHAVFLAIGKQKGMTLFGDEDVGETEVITGLEFLSDPDRWSREDDKGKILIIGGGNVAMDAARTLLRLSNGRGENIVVVCPEPADQMAALPEEVQEAAEEGLTIINGWAPHKLHKKQGRINSLDFHQAVVLKDEETGKVEILLVGDKVENYPAQKIMVAIGQALSYGHTPESVETRNGSIVTDRFGRTSDPRIFAGGDAVGRNAFVADAIAGGKLGALAIDCFLGGEDVAGIYGALRIGKKQAFSFRHYKRNPSEKTDDLKKVVPYDQINTLFFNHGLRKEPTKLNPETRKKTFDEVLNVLDPKSMGDEISRCFKCGTCIACDYCKDFCPDVSIIFKANSGTYDFDPDYCKGCGVCSVACPRNIIEMVKDAR